MNPNTKTGLSPKKGIVRPGPFVLDNVGQGKLPDEPESPSDVPDEPESPAGKKGIVRPGPFVLDNVGQGKLPASNTGSKPNMDAMDKPLYLPKTQLQRKAPAPGRSSYAKPFDPDPTGIGMNTDIPHEFSGGDGGRPLDRGPLASTNGKTGLYKNPPGSKSRYTLSTAPKPTASRMGLKMSPNAVR